MADDSDTKWHLDKRVPLALIVTITCQTMYFAWWGGALAQRVADLERNAMAAVPRLESVIRLETKVDVINSTLQELKNLINHK